MKRMYCCTAAGLLFSVAAVAQDATHTRTQVETRVIQHGAGAEHPMTVAFPPDGIRAEAARARAELDGAFLLSDALGPNHSVMSEPVKGAPYSAEEVSQFSQTLGDGTRIQRETKATVYRDAEGRVRRETPEQITIVDPAAKAMYILNPQTLTAYKSNARVFFFPPQQAGVVKAAGDPLPEAGAVATMQHATGGASGDGNVIFFRREIRHDATDSIQNGPPPAPLPPAGVQQIMPATPAERVVSFNYRLAGPGPVPSSTSSEALGVQMFDGVPANGNRAKRTIATGAIGNDRPIEIVSESWYSEELKTVVMSKRSDPLAGEETFRLGNIRRAEPDPNLFQVPPGFQVVEK